MIGKNDAIMTQKNGEVSMKYFEDRPCEKACMLLMQAARESIG